MKKEEVIIIGAGLVGSLLSIFLARRGYTVTVYERREDMRLNDISAGRSINLALSDRGIKALEEVGIMDEIRNIAIPMNGRYIHKADGESAYQPYGKEGQHINSVSRAGLNCKLMDLAEKEGVILEFSEKCTSINWQTNTVHFENKERQQDFEIKADIIFASDGAFSAARLQHQLHTDRFEYSQSYIDYGYKELTIPAGPHGSFRMEKNALHIWPRGNYMLIALPNMDGSFTCTLFFPFEGETSFASLDTPDKVSAFFKEVFPDAVAFMPDLLKEYFSNPTGSLVTVKCFPWIREDRFALIGDAAHAIVPFFGQGMNCGFEDCSVLNALLTEFDEDWSAVLKAYQELRKPDADAIAEMALANFVEMRDKVGDEMFLLQKKIENAFSAKYPGHWTPSYSLVTFSPGVRYSEALKISIRQELIMQEVMSLDGIHDNWDSEMVEQMMKSGILKD